MINLQKTWKKSLIEKDQSIEAHQLENEYILPHEANEELNQNSEGCFFMYSLTPPILLFTKAQKHNRDFIILLSCFFRNVIYNMYVSISHTSPVTLNYHSKGFKTISSSKFLKKKKVKRKDDIKIRLFSRWCIYN